MTHLNFKKKFYKKSTSEIKWNKSKLKSFKINPKEIDRIYVIINPNQRRRDDDLKNTIFSKCYYLLCRIDDKNFENKLYIEMMSCCDDNFKGGTIFISSDIDIFIKLASKMFLKDDSIEKIKKFIKTQDNYDLEKEIETFENAEQDYLDFYNKHYGCQVCCQ